MTLWCFPKDFRICAHRSAGRVPKGARRCPRSGVQSGVRPACRWPAPCWTPVGTLALPKAGRMPFTGHAHSAKPHDPRAFGVPKSGPKPIQSPPFGLAKGGQKGGQKKTLVLRSKMTKMEPKWRPKATKILLKSSFFGSQSHPVLHTPFSILF